MTKGEEKQPEAFPYSQLIKLVEDNDIDGLKAAFKTKSFDVNVRNSLNLSALHHAAISNNVEILEILTSHPNIDLNLSDFTFETPLIIAAKYGKSRAVKLLLEKGADIFCSDMKAIRYMHSFDNLECLEVLLRCKRCIYDSRIRDWVNEKMPHSRVVFELIRKLIIEASDPYYLNSFGRAVLIDGCKKGSLDTVKLIFEKGIFNINDRDYDQKTLLQLAFCGLNMEIVDYFIEKGADLNIKHPLGRSTYEYAAEFDKSETFLEKYEPPEEILEKVIERLIANSRQKTLRAYLEKCAGEKYLKLLNRAVYFAICHGRDETLKCVLSQNNDKKYIINQAEGVIGTIDSELFGPLYDRFLELETDDAQIMTVRSSLFKTAMVHDQVFVVKYLLERGADPNGVVYGEPCLLYACNRNYKSCRIALLLKYGADYRIKDSRGFTPLLLSAYHGHENAFFELFKLDKDLTQRSDDQLTPFLAACRSGNLKIIGALVEAGACLTDIDSDKNNCLHIDSYRDFAVEPLIFLSKAIDKKNFDAMLTAANDYGRRPIDRIFNDYNESTKSKLIMAIPVLAELLDFPKRIKIQSSSQEELCLICRDELVKDDCATVLACKHVFHENCYKEWGKRNAVCPYCQRPTLFAKK